VQKQAQKANYLSDLANGLTRTPRFLSATALPLGIFGTFMGLFLQNHSQDHPNFTLKWQKISISTF
jgi:hypothetical protein